MSEKSTTQTLLLRLAGPLQSWGGRSQFNRRDTNSEPTKSGVVGLLAAAQGRRRQDRIEDLLELSFGVRTDQPGSLLHDYHTVSDLRGRPLLSAAVNRSGAQKPTSPAKLTHITHRFYLQDAVFVAAVSGPTSTLVTLRKALRQPAFPLALGRRACVPTQPLVLDPVNAHDSGDGHDDDPRHLWLGDPISALRQAPWQAGDWWKGTLRRLKPPPAFIDLPITADDLSGEDIRADVPTTFDPLYRDFTTRRVRHSWAHVPTDLPGAIDHNHDPFALLGW